MFVLSALMLLLTIIAAVQAYANTDYTQYYYTQYYTSLYGYNYNYNYYSYSSHDDYYLDYYQKLPVLTGPYPRYYLFHKDLGVEYKYDDFRGYDSFIGYKDLDVYYPSLGVVDIIRNPYSEELDKSIIPEGMQTFGQHVYGFIPGPNGSCAMYVKHYGHEHPWEFEEYYAYASYYYTPLLAYKYTPQPVRSCQSINACQYNYCAACSR